MSDAACSLVARCFAARTSAHLAHLCTPSFAQHIALGDFYDAIATAADEFFECWMGVYRRAKITEFPAIRLSSDDVVTQLKDLRTWVASHREECCEDYSDDESAESVDKDETACTELGNLVDNVLAVVDRTIYKLVNLA